MPEKPKDDLGSLSITMTIDEAEEIIQSMITFSKIVDLLEALCHGMRPTEGSMALSMHVAHTTAVKVYNRLTETLRGKIKDELEAQLTKEEVDMVEKLGNVPFPKHLHPRAKTKEVPGGTLMI